MTTNLLDQIRLSARSSLKPPDNDDISKNQERQTFVFPADLETGKSFQDFESIEKYLHDQEEQQRYRMVTNLFRWEYDPNKISCKKLKLTCRRQGCSAKIQLSKTGDHFEVVKCEKEHTHSQDDNRQIKKSRKVMTPAVKVSLRDSIESGTINDYQKFQSTLKESKYKMLLTQIHNDNGEQTRVLTITSPLMKTNYLRYGEVVHFDITSHEIQGIGKDRTKYKLGVFYSVDTNIRMLIVGVSLFEKDTSVEIYEAIHQFLKIYHTRPLTIITGEDKSITCAINILKKNKIYKGSHIFDPWHILNNLQQQIQGPKQSRQKALRTIKNAILCRSLKEYMGFLNELTEDLENKELYDDFVSRASHICYCQIIKTFIGIRKFSRDRIGDTIKKYVPLRSSLSSLMLKLTEAEQYLRVKSYDEEDIFEETIEMQFKDIRIKDVRQHFQRKVFMRFLQNYVKGMQHYIVTSKQSVQTEQDQTTYKFKLANIKTQEEFSINDWQCECEQMQKTGIPCPHLIACARTVADKDYRDFFNSRWKKQRVEKKSQRPIPKSKKPRKKLEKLKKYAD